MRASWLLALNSLAGRRRRTALIIAAVALAGSLVAAVSCAMTSVQATLSLQIQQRLGAADARIIHLFNGSIPESVLDLARTWPEVRIASAAFEAPLTLVHADGRIDPETSRRVRATFMAVGVDVQTDRQIRQTQLKEGRDIGAAGEIVLDELAASKLLARIGDEVIVQRFGEPISLKIVGIWERDALGVLQRPQLQIDRRTLAEASNRPGELTGLQLVLREGTDVEEFCAAHLDELDKSLMLEPAEKVKTGFDRRLKAGRMGLVLAAVLAFMCASFIIVTGLSVGVQERQRELAIWRCVGATRRQLWVGQVWIGLIVGVLGAVVAIPLGIALAAALVQWYARYLPGGLHLSMLGLALATGGSIVAGLLGAVYPAFKAASVPPLQAMSAVAHPPRARQIFAVAVAAALLIGVQIVISQMGDDQTRFWTWAVFGLPALHIAYFLLAVPVFVLMAALLAGPISRLLGLPSALLRRSLLSTPFRNGFTAGALMVGMSMLVSTWCGGTSLLSNFLGRIKLPDGFAFRSAGISPAQQQAIASLPFVDDVCPIGYLPARVIGQHVFGVKNLAPDSVIVVGFDPDVFFRVTAVNWVEGDPATAIARLKQGDAILVAREFKTVRGMKVGDRIKLGAGRVAHDFEIVGVVEAPGLEIAIQFWGIRNQYSDAAIRCVFADWDAVGERFDNHDAYMMQVNHDPEIPDDVVRNQVTQAAPGVAYRSGRWIRQVLATIASTLIWLSSAIAMGALVVSCLGVANIVAAGIHARRFQFGVLRSVGSPRSLLLKLILAEVAVIAIAASLVGTILGLHVEYYNMRQYEDLIGLPLEFVIPWPQIAIGLGITLVMATLAAMPSSIGLMRRSPRVLLAAGRAG